MPTIARSENAGAVLRLRVKGLRLPVTERRRTAFQELVDAGIMVADGEDFEFAHDAQFSMLKPGTTDRSVSSLTTVHWPRASAMAATWMLTCCIDRPVRFSSAARRPYSSAASRV